MCHGLAIKAFPTPAPAAPFEDHVNGFVWGDKNATKRIAILPDIYGCNPFYRGLATRYAQMGCRVYLINPFHSFGELPEMTREEGFARRHKLKDKSFLDSFEAFAKSQNITNVIGFCLGGLYVFELARRGLDITLFGFYGFPQGMENQDPLDPPFNYLPSVTKSFTMLMGAEDHVVTPENVKKLSDLAPQSKAMDLKIYSTVGHNFLPLLDSDDTQEKEIALDALKRCDQEVFG